MSRLGALFLAGGLTTVAVAPGTSKFVPFCKKEVLKGAHPDDVRDLCNEFRLYVDSCAGFEDEDPNKVKRGMEVVANNISRVIGGQFVVDLSCKGGEASGGVKWFETREDWSADKQRGVDVAGFGLQMFHLDDQL